MHHEQLKIKSYTWLHEQLHTYLNHRATLFTLLTAFSWLASIQAKSSVAVSVKRSNILLVVVQNKKITTINLEHQEKYRENKVQWLKTRYAKYRNVGGENTIVFTWDRVEGGYFQFPINKWNMYLFEKLIKFYYIVFLFYVILLDHRFRICNPYHVRHQYIVKPQDWHCS